MSHLDRETREKHEEAIRQNYMRSVAAHLFYLEECLPPGPKRQFVYHLRCLYYTVMFTDEPAPKPA